MFVLSLTKVPMIYNKNGSKNTHKLGKCNLNYYLKHLQNHLFLQRKVYILNGFKRILRNYQIQNFALLYMCFTARKTESSPFEIDPDSGLIKLSGVLPESIPYYTLNITAYDDGSCCGGLTSLSSDSYIVVEIKDTNNNQPQFPNCNYDPVVDENQDIGTFVVQVIIFYM